MGMLVRFRFLASFVLSATALLAQATGRLSGVVTDSSGGVITDATVVSKNIDTGLKRELTTNQDGVFLFPDLPIGTYSLEVSRTGFKVQRNDGIRLLTGQVLDLRMSLTVGDTTQSVDVTAGAPLIQTTASSVQTSVEQKQMQDLPLNGRNPLQLTTLTPGAAITDTGTESGQQDNRGLTLNGLRATQNNFQLDGTNYTNRFFDSVPVMPNPDSLQEFTIQSSAYSAEYGGAGALVQLSTRSGSNEFHGTAFEFFRNTELNSRNFFQLQRPPFKLNQFGGTIGGPIKKNKTFFFFSGQSLIQRSAPSPVSITTPNAAQRLGNFSGISNRIIDPTTGQPFPNNIIPQNRLSPLAVRLSDLYLPLPNSGTQYISAQNRNVDDVQYLAKVDHVFSEKNRFSARYFLDQNDFQRPFNAPNGFFAANSFHNQTLTIEDTHIFSPTLTASFFASFGRFARTQTPQAPGMQTLQDLGARVPLGAGVDIFPGIRANITGFVNVFSGGALQQVPTVFDYRASATKIFRQHTFNFGFDFERDRVNANDFAFTPGDFTFSGQRTASAAFPNSGSALSDFYLGLPTTFFQDNGRSFYLRQSRPALYLQDDWRVTSHFTLNLGLRWEPWLPPNDLNNTLVAFAQGSQSSVAPNAPRGLLYPGDSGIPSSVWKRDWNNMAPRIGFAWNVGNDNRTVVRAGYGIFYTTPAALLYQRTNAMQPRVLTTNISSPASFVDPYANIPGGSPYPKAYVDPDQYGSYRFNLPVAGGVLDPTAKTGYSQNWNFTIERQFRNDLAVSFAYVGNHGVGIVGSRQLNPGIYGPGATLANLNNRRLYPGLGAVEIAAPYSYSRFDSLQINLNKRVNKGLTLLSNFVWSKTIDNTSSAIEGNAGPHNPFDWNSSRGPADFDQTFRFNLSGVYTLPHFKVTGFKNVLINDWQVNTIVTLTSGLPFTVLSGTDRSLSGVGADYADAVGNPARSNDTNRIQRYFNTAAFVQAAPGTFGAIGRNSLRGPNFANVDASIFKTFYFTEAWRLQFRAESFNVQNRANFNNPNATVSASSVFGRITAAADPRVLQFALKLFF